MDDLYRNIFISYMEVSEEVPFDIKGIDKNGQIEVDFNPEFLEFFNEGIKGYDNCSVEDFISQLINTRALSLV